MKKIRLLASVLLMAALLSSCGGNADAPPEAGGDGSAAQQDITLTMWLFPVGNWGKPTSVSSVLTGFHQNYPNIHVTLEYLEYEDGDALIEQAIAEGRTPDLVLEGPERLVANWGDRGLMADLSDLWAEPQSETIYETARNACRHSSGAYYEYPICMSAHCMAINYNMFQKAGALQYIDEETRTWTTEGFIKAVQALTAYGQKQVGVVYCKDQAGDQGTRALVNNLYGGSFTDSTHTHYTIDSEENVRALQLLYGLEGIDFAPGLSCSDEIELFCTKKLAMAFCWNVSQEIQQTVKRPDLDFEIFPMAFPTDQDQPELSSGIWGFGVFDSGDEERTNAAKTLIRFLTEDDAQYTRTVQTSTYWPVRDLKNVYVNDMLMEEYSIFTPYAGDYYQVTPGWTEARTAWWQLLQEVGAGAEIEEAVKDFP